MTPQQLEEIKARCEAATAGPWSAIPVPDEKTGKWTDEDWMVEAGGGNLLDSIWIPKADATFIAHARQDVPALLDEVERLRGCVQLYAGQFVLIEKLAQGGVVRQNGKVVAKWRAVSEEAQAGAKHARSALSPDGGGDE